MCNGVPEYSMSDFRGSMKALHEKLKGLKREHTACMTGLKNVQSSPHVTFAQPYQTVDCLRLDFDIFLFDHNVNELPDISFLQRTEPEPRAS